MSFTIDESGWPVVTLRWVGATTDEHMHEALEMIDRYLERGQRFGMLLDSRGSAGLSPEQRNLLLQHMKSRADVTSKLLVQAVVIDNVIHRTLYYGIRLLFPSPFPNRAFSDPGIARAWLVDMLGIPAKGRERPSAHPLS